MKVFIKYCGGCNPRYDRARMVRQLQRVFQNPFYLYTMHDDVHAAVVMCGCSCICANREDVEACENIFVVSSEEDFEKLCQFMHNVESEYKQ